jgi:anti-sigma regulatory factor (Ser/Thr protein kinase)
MHIISYLKLPAEIANLNRVIEFVSGTAAKEGFPPKKILEIELATEEVFVNICNYAYAEDKGEAEISLKLDANKNLVIEIADSGVPFNILEKEDPDIAADIESRSIGGLGIFFIKKTMDSVNYRRENDKNILSLTVLR